MLPDPERLSALITKALIFLAVGFLAVYFRTYALHGGIDQMLRSPGSLGRAVVDQGIRDQLRNSLEKVFPKLDAREKARLADLQLTRLKRTEQASYENTVKKAVQEIDRTRYKRFSTTRYLLEADPYHYLYQTERLLETGRISVLSKDGKYLQPLMRAPHGHWEVWSLHPYVGAFTYRLLRLFDGKITVTRAVSYVPLFLCLMVLLAYAGLSRILGFPWIASIAGMLTLVLSPIFIQRSALGWYDTDPYNYLFPIAILSCVFAGLQKKRRFWAGAFAAAFLNGLYSLFWTGWAFMLFLVPACLLTSAALLMFFRNRQPRPLVAECLRFLSVFVLASGVFLPLFLTPEGLWSSLRGGWSILNQFALAEFDVWPNIFLTVGEAGAITLNKLIFLTGNPVTFAFALAGVFLEGRRSLRKGDPFSLFRFLFFIIFSVPVLVMSLKTERFSLLFVLPLAIFVSFAMMRILELCQEAVSRMKDAGALRRLVFARLTVVLLLMVLFLPVMLLFAHVVASGIKPIMDDIWNDALLELRQKTPEDAIVNSWWPPGYFITGVARRRVTADGGTQHFHEAYWLAKALMTGNELEAAGILRMLNLSGDDAYSFLVQAGIPVPDAVDLILRIVQVGRMEAFSQLPSFFTKVQKDSLLDMTHGKGNIPPSYLLLYNDLIEQNLAVSVMAQWDFRKAMNILKQRRSARDSSWTFGRDAASQYVQDLMSVSGEFAKYTPASPLSKRKGDVLFFENGVSLDLAAKDVVIFVPSANLQKKPHSLFYLDQGQLAEKTFPGGISNISVLLFQEGETFYTLIADVRLMRSMLFRLYYLKGKGISFFQPLIAEGSLSGGTMVQVYELVRARFKE